MSRYFALRFDVDTFACANTGMPNLVNLAEKYGCALTFFVNMGRALSWLLCLNSLNYTKRDTDECAKKLSLTDKFGLRDTLYSLLLNPEVGNSCHEEIREAYVKGHEIGLHGGFNHALWHKYCAIWSKEKICNEIDFGINALTDVGIENITSFASPGWQGSMLVNEILEDKGFRVVADQHGTTDTVIRSVFENGQLVSIPTILSGEPCGVGFIENLRAEHCSDQEILNHVAATLQANHKHLVLYDHPGYVGIRELRLMEQIIKLVKNYNYSFVTMTQLADKISTGYVHQNGLCQD